MLARMLTDFVVVGVMLLEGFGGSQGGDLDGGQLAGFKYDGVWLGLMGEIGGFLIRD